MERKKQKKSVGRMALSLALAGILLAGSAFPVVGAEDNWYITDENMEQLFSADDGEESIIAGDVSEELFFMEEGGTGDLFSEEMSAGNAGGLFDGGEDAQVSSDDGIIEDITGEEMEGPSLILDEEPPEDLWTDEVSADQAQLSSEGESGEVSADQAQGSSEEKTAEDIASEEDDPQEQDLPEYVLEPETDWLSGDDIALDDPDTLLEEYMDVAFLGKEAAVQEITMSPQKKISGIRLTGMDAAVYDCLKPLIAQVAAGELSSTNFTMSAADLGLEKTSWTAAELGVDAIVVDGGISSDAAAAVREKTAFNMTLIMRSLLRDCPYELYWFDKTVGVSYSGFSLSASYDWNLGDYRISLSGNVSIRYYVSAEFSVSGEIGTTSVDITLTQAPAQAAENAKNIVALYAGQSDFNKLAAYRQEICRLVSYNSEAANGGVDYGNPWQLIWVFDGDPQTNVVCEGYAKAFQYLMQMTSFTDDISGGLVSGTMTGGTGSGGHMWNIVTMEDGENYLVDVTNCDAGTIGADDQLFLAGYASGNPEDGYTYQCRTRSIHYAYDDFTRQVYSADELIMADHAYVPSEVVDGSFVSNGFVFRLENNSAILTDCLHQTKASLTVPGEVKGYPVTEIETGAFGQCAALTDLELPESVTVIGSSMLGGLPEGQVSVIYLGQICSFYDVVVGEDNTWTETMQFAAGHTLRYEAREEASCETEGHTAYWHCEICGRMFTATDKNGEAIESSLVTEDVVRIPPTGHRWNAGVVTTQPGCETEGARTYTCLNDGSHTKKEAIPAKGHRWDSDYTIDLEPTETEPGQKSIHCLDCGKSDPESITVIPPLAVPVNGLTLSTESLELPVGKQASLTARITPENAANQRVVWTSSDPATATVDNNGRVTAKKYGQAVITARAEDESEGVWEAACTVNTLFYDVADRSQYYFRFVYWAADAGITKGYNLEYFDPQGVCTRSQMVTFLWRMAGSPAPTTTVCPFSDVKKSDYFYKAVLWAAEKGITKGYSSGEYKGQFGINLPCNRQDAMTFLWRYAGKPEPVTTRNPFSDIAKSDYFYKAVLWASEKGIAKGYSDGSYGKDVSCLREHMVTFLGRYSGI